ncbi:hypothetical protein [Streptomyces sp. ITFR-16]|uniref:SCO2400 family protein n=1 Tax=Streptomyces sp. ITFR-16 TaxID=3075198 RepID=UPI00288AAD59|nr:hypothetical protein [Streptomyces sp. ITFR-16]WNI24925.1 hypothetical protein RLT58_24920 [Streptomyces sp. ITFR-16]
MAFCQPCQRHLNGALACAGCGTPAEALSPYAAPAPFGHEPDARDEKAAPPAPAGRRRRGHGAARPRRGRSRRGRTVLLALLGVVLAAGALSLAELGLEPDGDGGGSDYVREATSVTTEPVPEPSGSEEARPPAPVDASPGSPSAVPAGAARPSGATRTAREADATPSGGAGATPDVPAPASSSAPAEPPVTSGAPSGPGGTDEGPTPSAPPPPPAPAPTPTPTPSPTPTDDDGCWFLWFC